MALYYVNISHIMLQIIIIYLSIFSPFLSSSFSFHIYTFYFIYPVCHIISPIKKRKNERKKKDGYKMNSMDRENKTGGGVAVYVDKNFNFNVEERQLQLERH